MELNITLSPESIRTLKESMAQQATPLFTDASYPTEVARILIDDHGDSLVNGIVDCRGEDLASKIAEQISIDDIVSNISTSDIAESVDTSEIAERVAENFDISEVADNISMRDLADEIDIDMDELADRVADRVDASSIASEFDLDEVAAALVDSDHDWSQHINHKQITLQLVTQFINNKEFRDCFVDTLVQRLAQPSSAT